MQILFQQYCKRFASDLSFAVIIYVITIIMPKLKRRKNVWEIFIVYFQFLNEAVFAFKPKKKKITLRGKYITIEEIRVICVSINYVTMFHTGVTEQHS